MKLINLHTRTEYTFLSSTIKLDSLIKYAVEKNLKTLVITDLNSMFGVPKFYKLCKQNNINPVIGLEIEIENFHFILLARNYSGYVVISELVSRKTKQNDIFLKDLLEKNDIIIIDHPKKGYYFQKKTQLSEIFDAQKLQNYYIVENNPEIANSIYLQERSVLFSKEKIYLEALAKIKGDIFDFNAQFYDFDQWEQEIDPIIIKRTNSLVENIIIEFPKIEFNLPDLNNESGLKSDLLLKKILKEATEEKQADLVNYNWKSRLQYEYETICSLNFSNYFLIIWDLLKWARGKKILIGPGRGSASGSLIAYLLGITAVNPLKYDLIFERFLNPKRITMPDIDIDIQDTRRHEIINYLFEKYGNNHCATIITFSTLAAKSVFRDISKAFGIPEVQVNKNAKLISSNMNLAQLYAQGNTPFRKLIDQGDNLLGQNNSEVYKKIYKISVFLEGMPRQSSTHAAGIVLSKIPIQKLVPVHFSKESLSQIQYSAEFLEDFSLLKIDLLGLKNLTIVANILTKINESGKNLNFEQLPIHENQTNKLLSQGKTCGIFQLESPGMTASINKIGVNSINDVIAIISLFRPGPIRQIPTYAKNKQTNSWEKIFPEYDKIVESTFGVIIYQEQIMQICQVIAGFDLEQADIIRVAISKKDEAKITKIRESFIKNGTNLGYDSKLVNRIYDLVYKFSDYGFNKAHAVAYATLAYKMAYLKAKYPAYFFVELISNENGSQENIKKYVDEAKNFGFEIHRPNINFSTQNAVFVESKNAIFLPLLMIKGLGAIAVKTVVDERQKNGLYKNFFDFIRRMKLVNFSKAALEKLILSNALSDFDNQETLAHNFELIWNHGSYVFNDKDGNLVTSAGFVNPDLNFLEKIPYNQQKNYENELKYLGMSFIKRGKSSLLDNQIMLKELKSGIEYRLILELKKVTKLKNNNEFYLIIVSDGESDSKIFTKNPNYLALQTKKYYEFIVFLTKTGKFYLKGNPKRVLNYE